MTFFGAAKVGLTVGALLIAFGGISAATARNPVPSGSPLVEIDIDTLKAHMTYLADDLLEGREAGTRGNALAALYLQTQFAAIGLQPAGDKASYLQCFRVRTTRLDLSSVDFRMSGPSGEARFENGADVAIFGDPLEANQRVEAPVVFAGFGIVAPERGIDDYRGLDVRGKIVATLGGPAAFMPAAEAAHYASTNEQRLQAEAHGAIGLVTLWTPAQEERSAFSGLKSILGRTDVNWIGPDGAPKVIAPGIRLRAFVRGAAAQTMFKGAPQSFAQILEEAKTSSPKGFELASRVSLARKSRHNDSLSTTNVAGLLPGSDPKLKNETIVLTAHYDHIGIGTPKNGDAIYNGALDNAFGTAALIEVAREIAAMKQRPKRSILFLAVGAEEKGLIGSDYFAEHPTLPRASLVANINLDGAMPFYDFRDVIAFGAEQSDMGKQLVTASAGLGLTVAPDPFPEQSIFTRSDQYSFVLRGVPALFLYMGFTSLDGRNVGRKVWDDFIVERLHEPSDDLAQPIDYAVAAKFTDVFRRLTLETANAPERPRWYRDSVFGARYAANAPKATR